MQVIAAGQPCSPGKPHGLPFLHPFPGLDINPAQVPIHGKNAHAMVNNHRIAVDTQGFRQDHHAVVGRRHRAVQQGSQVLPLVHLLIHVLILIDISALIAEAGHGFADETLEGPDPQRLRLARGADLANLVMIGLAHFLVDFQVSLEKIPLV